MGNNPFENRKQPQQQQQPKKIQQRHHLPTTLSKNVAPGYNRGRNLGGYAYLYGKENMGKEADDAEVLFSGLATGPPSKDHWKPDSAAIKCSMACCPREFGLFERRHHCRKCGDIFCGTHCSHYIRLDQNSNFNLAGSASRVCDRCYEEYVRLLNKCKKADRNFEELEIYGHNSRHRDSGYYASSGSESGGSYENTDRYRSIRKDESDINKTKSRRPLATQCNEQVPAIPPDWTWSTF
ncbi:13659_t:CDS:2 [Ambispora gerdemannii]|uniref:13659_t:CDS:1 n=1 Tax=Ambispora gerdemannii TaxID=144530 RepID=A0A9N8WD67_9GLOM|nr:13659_t:CDS:2 [Ambispora gerdemannii]